MANTGKYLLNILLNICYLLMCLNDILLFKENIMTVSQQLY